MQATAAIGMRNKKQKKDSTEQRPMISRMEVMIIRIEKQQKTIVIARRTVENDKRIS